MNVNRCLVAAILVLISASSHANLLYFTDRAQFEANLAAFTVDDFSSLTSRGQGSYSSSVVTYTGSMWGCTDDNSSDTGCEFGSVFDVPGNEWLWTYNNGGLFSTPSNVSAFGFDFASTISPFEVSALSINGFASTNLDSGFFGVLSTDNSSIGSQFQISWSASNNYMGYDNIITSSSVRTTSVSEPGSLLVLALGYIGFAAFRKIKARNV